ncbi:recombinase family protein [Chitinophaga sp.]|uniref:recombinase family protein n=1 Tax=Chitinophaga sp. TaxID=1869181 RepID=UPI002F9577A4
MKADLYIRVSTDEQADKGFSQRDQEERLRKYCQNNQISIRKVILEDHSAKTFERPEWRNEILDLKKRKDQIDVILFTKWDRFSRNAGDAYQMINILRKLGVEPQAIEQPLDMAVPENKIMLAVYLAAPEVENDRRALNVLYGMRRAKKEGRWMGQAPVGYANKITEDMRKYIAPVEPYASIMKWVFNMMVTGQYQVEQLYKEARLKGIRCCKTNFWNLLRNPVYCGKIYLSAYKDEPSTHVPGLHEPIISESLFYEVQDLLDGKKKNYRTKVGSQEIMQLRGHLLCPKCGHLLTGSASRGRNGIYYYYHCKSSCGARFKAEAANDLFTKELRKFVPRVGMAESYKVVVNAAYKAQAKGQRSEVKEITDQLNEAQNDIAKARKLLLKEEIDAADYKTIKGESEKRIMLLEAKLMDAAKNTSNIESLLDNAVKSLVTLDQLYKDGDVKKKRQIIGSIFPEKLVFDGSHYRTARLNEAVKLDQVENLGD